MLKIYGLILIGIISIFIVGCAETNLETSKEHTNRVKRNMDKDMKNLVEDWDSFWMQERPSRATPNTM